jgi:hypothetical protein
MARPHSHSPAGTRQQITRGSQQARWAGTPALIDEHGGAFVLSGPPRFANDALYVTVRASAGAGQGGASEDATPLQAQEGVL